VRTLAPRQILKSSKEIQVLPSGEAREEGPLGRQRESNLSSDCLGLKLSVGASYEDSTTIRQQHGRDQFQSSAFSAPIRTEKGKHFSRGGVQRDFLECMGFCACSSEPKEIGGAKDLVNGFDDYAVHCG